MKLNSLHLLRDKRFLPIFVIQFCGCLNDSIIKNALIMLITFKLSQAMGSSVYFLVMLSNALLVLPFVVFASLAGQLADRYERTLIVKIIKLAEIVIVLLTIYGFYIVNIPLLLTCIALMGIHSTFFGPIKYSVLPDQLQKSELLFANGLVEAGTFFSILVGTILGGFYNYNNAMVMTIIMLVAVIGFIATIYMPRSNNANPKIKVNCNIIAETHKMVKYAASKKKVYLSILGISWFWFIGAVILAQIPFLTRDILKADENVANLFLATFSIGVGVGSFLCSKLLSNKITTRYVFLAALGISIFGIELYFSSTIAAVSYEPMVLKTVQQFLSRGHYLRILVDIFCLACIGGLYVVPLFTVMQYFTVPAYRSRVIAVNNLINSLFMAGSAAILSLLIYMEFSIPVVILIVSLLNMVIAIHIYQLIPNSKVVPLWFWRAIFKFVLRLMYRIEVTGLENYKAAGQKVVIIANHFSYLDPPLIATYLPENIQFAVNLRVSKAMWVKPFLKILKTHPIDQSNPMAIKSLIDAVKKGNKIVIFPEGRTSTTGALMKIYEGPGMIADKSAAMILPIRIEGTQFTIFSKIRKLMNGNFVLRRKIEIKILPPRTIDVSKNLESKNRRRLIGQALYNIMNEMLFVSSSGEETLFQSMLKAAKTYKGKAIIHDVERENALTYRKWLFEVFVLSHLLSQEVKKKRSHVPVLGMILPNTVLGMTTFFAAQACGYTVLLVDFTLKAVDIVLGCQTAQVKRVYSSRKFIAQVKLEHLVQAIKDAGINIIYMEDLEQQKTNLIKLKSWLACYWSEIYYKKICNNCSYASTAVIFFGNGSNAGNINLVEESPAPKMVALSHYNLQSNRYQILSSMDIGPGDKLLNALPIYNSMGLVMTLMTCFGGIKTFCCHAVVDDRLIPEIIYDINPTVVISSSQCLSRYMTYAHPYDFFSVRYVIAVITQWQQQSSSEPLLTKFGIKWFDCWGMNEGGAITMNTPMYNKPGSIGRFMPCIEYYLQPVDNAENRGRLYVKGPNLMQGYINVLDKLSVNDPSNPIVVHWCDTGIIVSVDDEGYVTIHSETQADSKNSS